MRITAPWSPSTSSLTSLIVAYKGPDDFGGYLGFVSKKIGRPNLLTQAKPYSARCGFARTSPGCPRFLALAFHCLVKAGNIYVNITRPKRVLCEI